MHAQDLARWQSFIPFASAEAAIIFTFIAFARTLKINKNDHAEVVVSLVGHAPVSSPLGASSPVVEP